jgi:hypothetical protein
MTLFPTDDIQAVINVCPFPASPDHIEAAAPLIAAVLARLPYAVTFAACSYGCGLFAGGLVARGAMESEAVAFAQQLQRAILRELTKEADRLLDQFSITMVH